MVQVGLLEKGYGQVLPSGQGPPVWVRGSLTYLSTRNEGVCFWLDFSPTTDETGWDCTFQIPGGLGNCPVGPAWSLRLLSVACCPPQRPWGLAAWMRTLLVAKGAGNIPPPLLPPPSRLPGSFSQISSQILTCVVGISPDTVRTRKSAACAAAQRHDNSVASLEKGRCAQAEARNSCPVMRPQGRSGPACPRPGALRTCVLSWSKREPWKLSRGMPGSEMYSQKLPQ